MIKPVPRGRPEIPEADRAVVVPLRMTKKDKAVLKKRGAGAYVRQVLRTPLVPAHDLTKTEPK